MLLQKNFAKQKTLLCKVAGKRRQAFNQRFPLCFKNCTEVDFNEKKFATVLDRMSEHTHADPCTLTNPGKPTPADVKRIYESAYYEKKIN